MSAPHLPTAAWEGVIIVLGMPLICVVLDDGRRIIEGKSLERFFEELSKATEFSEAAEAEFKAIAEFMRGKGLPRPQSQTVAAHLNRQAPDDMGLPSDTQGEGA